jgi:permease
MELLSLNQPYNLILFMVIPVGFTELLVAMEFLTMYHMDSGKNAGFKAVGKFAGIVLGVYFTALVIYFMAKIYPSIKWRGYADVIAVYSYLISVIPLLGIALLELNLIYKNASEKAKLKLHFCLLIFALIVAHVAMIFGMVDPTITGYKAENGAMDMHMNMPMNMPADMPMHDHHKMMQNMGEMHMNMMMQNMSDDNSTNMHMHH